MTNQRDKQQTAELANKSNDHQYFILTQHIVWALCEDPYEFTLWSTIKMITRQGEPCRLTTPDLADLCMMSMAKLHECRKRLIDIGLLEGEIKKRDLHNPQPIWHLTIPDLWRPNIEWAQEYNTLKKRLDFKRLQRCKFKQNRKNLREIKDNQILREVMSESTLQVNEVLLFGKGSQPLQVVEPFRLAKIEGVTFSPGENGPLSHENGPLPGENSLYIQEQYQEQNQEQEKTTTTILGTARAAESLGGGGFESTPHEHEADELNLTAQDSDNPLPTPDNGLFSRQTKITAMRIAAAELIEEIPTRWWARDEYLNSLSPRLLFSLCSWLWSWHLVHQPLPRGGLLTDHLDQIEEQKAIKNLYASLWSGIHNEPAVIKTRIQEAQAPLEEYDQEQLKAHLRNLCTTLENQKESEKRLQ